MQGILSVEHNEQEVKVDEVQTESQLAAARASIESLTASIEKEVTQLKYAEFAVRRLEATIAVEDNIDPKNITKELIAISAESLTTAIELLGGNAAATKKSIVANENLEEAMQLSVEGAKNILGKVKDFIVAGYKSIKAKLSKLFKSYSTLYSNRLQALAKFEEELALVSDLKNTKLFDNIKYPYGVEPFSLEILVSGDDLPEDPSGVFKESLNKAFDTSFIQTQNESYEKIVEKLSSAKDELKPSELVEVIDNIVAIMSNNGYEKEMKFLLKNESNLQYPIVKDSTREEHFSLYATYGWNLFFSKVSYDKAAYAAVKKMSDENPDIKTMEELIESFNVTFQANEIKDRIYNNLDVKNPSKDGLVKSINVSKEVVNGLKGFAKTSEKQVDDFNKFLIKAIKTDPNGEMNLKLLRKLIDVAERSSSDEAYYRFKSAMHKLDSVMSFVIVIGSYLYLDR